MTPYFINHPYKHIHDTIHGYIAISDIRMEIIDTAIFQRLRYLRQLGGAYFVYQNATHTRFDHSIGTSYLAERILLRIKSVIEDNNYAGKTDIRAYLASITELQPYYSIFASSPYTLDDYVMELVKIGALCHDLGHGPFSHLYDDWFLTRVRPDATNHPMRHHESRSIALLIKIVMASSHLRAFLDIKEGTSDISLPLQFIIDIIHPRPTNKGFLYQIVSNYLTGIDVDKFDYLTRDAYTIGIPMGFNFDRLVNYIYIINTHICYQQQSARDIIDLFTERHKFHKTVYSHKAVVSAQLMLTEIMVALDPILHQSRGIDDMELFCTFTDDYILDSIKWLFTDFVQLSDEQKVARSKATDLIHRLYRHELYAHIGTHIGETYLEIEDTKDPDIEIYVNNIGYVSNKSNPFKNILMYSTKNKTVAIPFLIEDYTKIYSTLHTEALTMIFYKGNDSTKKQWFKNLFTTYINNSEEQNRIKL